jgi:hypothetical protein
MVEFKSKFHRQSQTGKCTHSKTQKEFQKGEKSWGRVGKTPDSQVSSNHGKRS